MKHLLSRECRPLLTSLVLGRTLFAFDFDGTLAPIVDHPETACLRPETTAALAKLALLHPCVVISGRSRSDVLNRLKGLPLAAVVGNHGAEFEGMPIRNPLHNLALIDAWKSALSSHVCRYPGVWVEDKGLSLAVHYRQSNYKDQARKAVMSLAGGFEGADVFGGKEVVNVVPAGAADKGHALAVERRRLQCDEAVFFGDDENDEEAFGLVKTVGVRIGRKDESRASYYLESQLEIDECLKCVVDTFNIATGQHL